MEENKNDISDAEVTEIHESELTEAKATPEMPDDNNENDSPKENAFVKMVVGVLKTIASLFVFTVKTFLSFFIALKTGAKAVFIIIVLTLFLLGFAVGFNRGAMETRKEIERELGGADYNEIKQLIRQINDTFKQ